MGKDKANKNIISGGWNEWTMVYRPPPYNFSDEKLAFASLGNRAPCFCQPPPYISLVLDIREGGFLKRGSLDSFITRKFCYCKLFFPKILLAKINFDARFCKKMFGCCQTLARGWNEWTRTPCGVLIFPLAFHIRWG